MLDLRDGFAGAAAPIWSRNTLPEISSTAPGAKVAELKRPVGDADQPIDLEAKRLEHAAHLAVLAFAQRERDPGIGCLVGVQARR